MKICHLTSVHPATDVRIFKKECGSLQRAGYEVTIIAPGPSQNINGIQIIGVAKRSSRIGRMVFTVNDVLKEAIRVNADVYHFHDPELIRVGIQLLHRGKKVIYDVHEDLPRQLYGKYYLPKWIAYLLSKIMERYENISARHFNAIITVTPSLEKRFSSHNKNTIQISNFPDLNEFNASHVLWEKRKNELCYIGSISEGRGIRQMLLAVESLDTRLHLAGNFSPPSLRDQMIQLPSWKKVIEYGFVDREQVKEILSTVKAGLVLLHPSVSYQEAYPVKLFEYMAAGIPVIASDFNIIRNIVMQPQPCGICVNPLNVQEIELAITQLFQDNSLSQKRGQAGKDLVTKKYNWQQEEKKLLDLYRQLQTPA